MSERAWRVVALGGGNGLSAVLRSLRFLVEQGMRLEITAVVATADDGGSSGRLRRERGGLPPGDLRNCLLALSREEGGVLAGLFGHRFAGNGEIGGHALGNLILAALAERQGDYISALETAGKMLRTAGRVLPATLEGARLEGETAAGGRLSGESAIGRTPKALRAVWLEPPGLEPTPGVCESIEEADLVVIGPGSLFTSILAVLLVPGVAGAIRACGGKRVLVGNLMTQPGETAGLTLAGHLEVLDRHLGPGLVDRVLTHRGRFSPARVAPYRAKGSEPVLLGPLAGRRERFVEAPLATKRGPVRHDPRRLAAVFAGLLSASRPVWASPLRQQGLRAGGRQP